MHFYFIFVQLFSFFFANIFFLVLLPQKMTEMIATTAAHSMPKSKKKHHNFDISC